MNNTKALVVISFGSTFDDTRKQDIGGIEQALADAFEHYDQYRAFTSSIVRKRLAERGIKVDDPDTMLSKLKEAGYEEVLLQPTHLLHGEEYEQKILTLKEKYQNSFKKIAVGEPLIAREEDYNLITAAIALQFPELGEGEGVVLMGHGTPRNNNKAKGCTYVKLQKCFDAMKLPVIIGTVEDEDTPNFAAVLDELKNRHYKSVHLYPLMVVAGDHANNDMYGPEESSWKNQIEALGVKTTGHMYGLGRSKAIEALYVKHMLRTIAGI